MYACMESACMESMCGTVVQSIYDEWNQNICVNVCTVRTVGSEIINEPEMEVINGNALPISFQ